MVEIAFDSGSAHGSGEPGTVVTVGTFDGVHLGHRAVLRALIEVAREDGAPSLLVTFEPHPVSVVRPEAAPKLLTTPAERRDLLTRSGVDRVVFLRFTPELAALSAREFVERVLVDQFGLRHLVVGHDHGLGRGRSGDVDALRGFGREFGFDVDVVEAEALDGVPVSSTRIRDALAEGDVRAAARALGRPYALRGEVVRGEGKGRELGVPTANLRVDDPDKLLPREGIYAVCARLAGDEPRPGVLHLGPRPTFDDLPETIELHLLDFADRDLYGENVQVEFEDWIRPVLAFDSADALIVAMEEDRARARELLSAAGACQR